MRLHEIFSPEMLLEIPEEELDQAKRILQHTFMKDMGLNFTFRRHTSDRVVGPDARDESVTKDEIVDTLTKLIAAKKGKIMGAKQRGKEYEAVVTNMSTNLNIVFAINFGTPGDRNLFKVITMHRKKNFKAYGDARFYV